MLVKKWMRENVFTVDANATMQDAMELLKKHEIRMLPVMEEGNLVGVVTDRDLKKASIPDIVTFEVHKLLDLISEIKVKDLMTKDPITVPLDYTVEETAEVLLKNKISGVPVVNHEGKLVGMITQSDLFSVLMSVTGMGRRGLQYAIMQKRGIKFAFQVEDRPGCIKELESILRKYGGRVRSIMSTYTDTPEGYRKVYIRMYGINREKLPQLKDELREKAELIYMVDHRKNIRETYQ